MKYLIYILVFLFSSLHCYSQNNNNSIFKGGERFFRKYFEISADWLDSSFDDKKTFYCELTFAIKFKGTKIYTIITIYSSNRSIEYLYKNRIKKSSSMWNYKTVANKTAIITYKLQNRSCDDRNKPEGLINYIDEYNYDMQSQFLYSNCFFIRPIIIRGHCVY